jgi:transposase
MTVQLTATQTVIVGVDTHQRTHHAVVVDTGGRRLGDQEFPVSEAGYARLLNWAAGFGVIDVVGVESTGSYGAGLTRSLLAAGVEVIEVNAPEKATRARNGKSDPIDADAAARAVLTGRASARPKVTTGVVESIRALKVVRDSAVKNRTAAISQLRDLITTAPAVLHDQLIGQTTKQRIARAARFRLEPTAVAPEQVVKMALRTLAHRIQDLEAEIANLDAVLKGMVAATVPTLISKRQISTQTAAQLLITAGQNPDRFRSEAAFAKLTGAAPLPASSGKSNRMRLNRGGDRQANKALHLIAVGRLKDHQPTINYARRREAEGLSRRDIIRCLKRYIARETYNALKHDLLRT